MNSTYSIFEGAGDQGAGNMRTEIVVSLLSGAVALISGANSSCFYSVDVNKKQSECEGDC
jgi:hypothetical protein